MEIEKILGFNEVEKPLALQVGGSDKNELSEVVKLLKKWDTMKSI